MAKGVVYSRISSEMQMVGDSIDTQINKCKLYAEAMDIEVVDVIKDEACTGTKMSGREGLLYILDGIKKKKFDTIICYSLSRLTRSLSDLQTLIEYCNKYKASIVSTKESINSGNSSGRLLISLITLINSFEVDQLKERTSDTLRYKREVKKERISRYPDYGFDFINEHLVENDSEQKHILTMVELRASGKSFQKIADHLNTENIPSKLGGKWSKQVVRKVLLRNEELFHQVA